ncbi:MAG: hypothetical protein ABL966_13745, partial [Acidimicrobiales bacterium]
SVEPVPDPTDLAARIAGRSRRATRGLASALALALIAGPAAGWVLARQTEADRQSVAAGGAGADTVGSDEHDLVDEDALNGGFLDYFGPELALVGERTTAEGLHLAVRMGQPYDIYQHSGEDPCLPDGIVRVGVTAPDLVGAVTMETQPDGAAFGVTGAAEGRPLWVVVARAPGGTIEATFPNGTVDRAEAVGGLAVLAAFASDAVASDLLDDTIGVTGMSEAQRAGSTYPAQAYLMGGGGCSTPTVLPGPPVSMPEPGEPPADEPAARAAITDTWLTALEGSGEDHPELRERPDVWLDSHERFVTEQPDYAAMAPEVYAEVDEIVFTAPDRASVRFRLISDNPSIPAPGERIGEAVLIDGTWKVSIETSCELVGLAGIECDYDL